MQCCKVAKLQSCNDATLQCCNVTMLQICNVVTLQCCNVAGLQSGNVAKLQRCKVFWVRNIFGLKKYGPEKNCWSKKKNWKFQRFNVATMHCCNVAHLQSCNLQSYNVAMMQSFNVILLQCCKVTTTATLWHLQEICDKNTSWVHMDGHTDGPSDSWASWGAVKARNTII